MPIGIDGGVKLTGRIDGLSIGALAIRQEAGNGIAASDLFVARGTYNVLEESALGFVVTHGDPTSNDSNSVLGVDFLYRDSSGPFGEILTGQLWAQQSRSTGIDGDDGAFGLHVEIPSDKLSAYVGAQLIEENFTPALGFVNRSGIRRIDIGTRYRYRPAEGFWRAFNAQFDAYAITDMDGNTLSRQFRFRPSAYSNRDDFLFVELQQNREVVENDFDLFGRLPVAAGDYSFDRVRAEIATGMQRPLQVVLSVQDGGFFNGDRLEKFVEVQWKPSEHFALGASFTENVVDLPSGSFTAHLASLRTDVAFNSKWSWSNLLQYDNTAERYAINSRLRFNPEAGREMVLVVNHGGIVDSRRDGHNDFRSTNRDLNLKLSYTFRY